MLLGILEARHHRPHRRDFERVRRDVLVLDLPIREVLLVDPDLFGELRDVGDVDLDRAIPQGFHELVVQELLVFGLVRVTEDHLVDVGLRELLRLDLVLLRRAEQIVEERDVELEHLDELDDAAVGDVELAVEVERARVGVRSILGDLPVVDVTGQLGRVLVLLVLRLERADADAVLLAQHEAPAANVVLNHLRPVAVVLDDEVLVDEPTRRIELAFDAHLVLLVREADAVDRLLPPLRRDEAKRLFVHRTGEDVRLGARPGEPRPFEVDPVEGVERPFARARVVLDPLLQEARDRALRRADRPVEKDDALLGAVPFARRAEHVDESHQRDVEAEDGVAAGA